MPDIYSEALKQGLARVDEALFALERAVALGDGARPEAEALEGALDAFAVLANERLGASCAPHIEDLRHNLAMLREGVAAPGAPFVALIANLVGLVRSSARNETPDPTRLQTFGAARPVNTRALRALIADPDTINRRLLAGLIEPLGECDQAEDGDMAMNRIRGALSHLRPYDAIFLSLIMSGRDGRSVMMELRRLENAAGEKHIRPARVIFTLSLSDTGVLRASGLVSQADGVLYKPIRKTPLMDQLKQLGLIEQTE